MRKYCRPASQRRQPVSEINYQALREAAEKATWGDWDSYKPHRGARGYEVRLSSQAIAQHVLKNNAEFIAAFNPKVALALLDEREKNQQYIKLRDQENEDIALTVGKLRVELEAEKQMAKVLFMENARLKSGIAGLIHLGIRYADVEVMKIAGDAQLSTPCTDSIINSIATGIRINGGE
ncbi:ead/Ea22-like family protein [Escherichia coli]|uniref:ead/Ea22-like family protein n=1 Tax=Escherichia coli TaxID=562 RepID=UPI0014460628|nr:ead/Ea22-like family protein [Escherichia coli]